MSAGRPAAAAPPVPGARVRALAAELVDQVLREGRSLKVQLGRNLGRLGDPRDRALLESLCFETLRWRRRYEFVLATWLARPLQPRDARVHALLLVGLAQLDTLRLPAHAALAATVEAVRELGRPALVGLVNALLRRATREPLPESDDDAVRLSHPDWLLQTLRQDWPAQADAVLAANNREAPMWLRVNPRRASVAQYREQLAAAGIACAAPGNDAARTSIQLAQAVPPARLPGWDQGLVSIQDGAAQLAVEALAPPAGARVLDACAAPGGKAMQMLEADPALVLTALDVDPRRLQRLESGLSRLGLASRARLVAADACDPAAWWDGHGFDAILLDAPCSATGIIRRQPDIKWHRRPDDVAVLVALQARLLDALWPTLAPGGVLVYATCSVLRAENAQQVEAFLSRTPDAVHEPLGPRFGERESVGCQRFPGDGGMDGFYYARLRRAAPH